MINGIRTEKLFIYKIKIINQEESKRYILSRINCDISISYKDKDLFYSENLSKLYKKE